MDKIYFVLPAYNEAENIEETIKEWYPVVDKLAKNGVDAKLVIANDGSKDNTFEIMQQLAPNYPLFEPVNKPNSGHGATCIYLYRYAIKNGANYVFQTDSDGQTNPNEFMQLWENRAGYDMVIGKRKGRKDGSDRVVISKVLKCVVRLTFGVWVPDSNVPFRLMKTEKLEKILDVVPSDSFLGNVAIAAIAVKWKYTIKWIEITFQPRQGGESFVNLKRIFKIGWKAVGDFITINKNLG